MAVARSNNMDFVIALSQKDYKLSVLPPEDKMEDSKNKYKTFGEYLRGELPCDVNLVVADTTVPAHKSLLVAASEYFRAMFSGDFTEANRSEIVLPALSLQGLNAVLDALYTGTLSLTNTNVLEILATADQVGVQDILECCEEFLILGTDTANCFELLQLSEKYTLPRLNLEIEQFVLRNFTKVCEHSLFPCISQEALITFISNDELDFREIDIFKGVMNWFKDDPSEDKRKGISEVLEHIRFTYMGSKDILNEVLNKPFIIDNAECTKTIEDALKYVISYEEDVYSRPILEASKKEKPRGKMCILTVPPMYGDGEESRMLNVPAIKQLLFFGFNNDLVDMSDMTVCESEVDFAVFSMSILQMGHSVFFLGAQPLDEDANDAKMALLRLNVQSGEWATLKEPDFPPTVVSVSVLHDNYLYFFGGAAYSNKKTIPQTTFKKGCFRYSIPNDSWSRVADYPHPVSHPAACVIGDEIYVSGGGGLNVHTWDRDRVFAYNTRDDTWTEKCALTTGRAGHRVCSINGKMYVLGGRDPHRVDVPECEVYDPSQDQWTVLESAPIPRSVASYAMVVHNDNITLLGGGCDKEVRHPLAQTFDTKELGWTSYNWKNDHPDLLLSGSIHQLPIVRARLCCFTEYSANQSEADACSAEPTQSKPDDNQPTTCKTKRKPNSNARHCSTQ